ncbi:MAG TPA: hypothetical protein IGS52_06570 [Oscillatoriaceae cyanobacterium M33_DOE_052]|uniref:Tellurite resistance protein TerB n=1 Tax=Planktothricoides sp. SpSt-374 TaxID=2282167 RepID=A0A7C3ZLJ2_9CYAN|nr:hypothetical protein [Oscillatoriaceae cyanobacterium M33_DOE_052]
MGKYDFILNSEEETEVELDETEAVAAIAYIAGAVDFATDGGVGAKVEAEFLQGFISGILSEDITVEYLVEQIQVFKDIIDEAGPGALYNAAYNALPEELVPAAFMGAYAMCLIDGDLPDGAAKFLVELQESLEISDEDAEEFRNQVVAILEGEE